MVDSQQDEAGLLRELKSNAARLIAGLVAQRDDLGRATAGQLAPKVCDAGGRAFAGAIDAARRTLAGIDRASATDPPPAPPHAD